MFFKNTDPYRMPDKESPHFHIIRKTPNIPKQIDRMTFKKKQKKTKTTTKQNKCLNSVDATQIPPKVGYSSVALFLAWVSCAKSRRSTFVNFVLYVFVRFLFYFGFVCVRVFFFLGGVVVFVLKVFDGVFW